MLKPFLLLIFALQFSTVAFSFGIDDALELQAQQTEINKEKNKLGFLVAYEFTDNDRFKVIEADNFLPSDEYWNDRYFVIAEEKDGQVEELFVGSKYELCLMNKRHQIDPLSNRNLLISAGEIALNVFIPVTMIKHGISIASTVNRFNSRIDILKSDCGTNGVVEQLENLLDGQPQEFFYGDVNADPVASSLMRFLKEVNFEKRTAGVSAGSEAVKVEWLNDSFDKVFTGKMGAAQWLDERNAQQEAVQQNINQACPPLSPGWPNCQ